MITPSHLKLPHSPVRIDGAGLLARRRAHRVIPRLQAEQHFVRLPRDVSVHARSVAIHVPRRGSRLRAVAALTLGPAPRVGAVIANNCARVQARKRVVYVRYRVHESGRQHSGGRRRLIYLSIDNIVALKRDSHGRRLAHRLLDHKQVRLRVHDDGVLHSGQRCEYGELEALLTNELVVAVTRVERRQREVIERRMLVEREA
mmetsp:Transcript_1526/g.4061  ORF Transcript_1526/g.4061 Transcript_1526/m.4061 type:complete len:202 (+) Transcript_1526:1064-1669(+)